MFDIDHLEFTGNNAFDEMVDYLFGKHNTKRVVDDNGVKSIRVYFPGRKPAEGNCDVSPNEQPTNTPSWRKEVRGNADIPEWTETPSEPSPKPDIEQKPKSILEMLEDGDERLERILGKIIDKKLAERNIVANEDNDDVEDENENENEEATPLKKDAFVFIANRLTFLIQALQPIVFDTSLINTDCNTMTIAINEDKTIPIIRSIEDLGFITSKVNSSSMVIQEIENYLSGTEFTNIYCFPDTIENKDGKKVFAVKFVVYPLRRSYNF